MKNSIIYRNAESIREYIVKNYGDTVLYGGLGKTVIQADGLIRKFAKLAEISAEEAYEEIRYGAEIAFE